MFKLPPKFSSNSQTFFFPHFSKLEIKAKHKIPLCSFNWTRDLEAAEIHARAIMIWLFISPKNNWTVTPKPVQEEKHYEPEVKTTKAAKAKPTASSAFSGGNRRFGGHKSTNAKAPVQDNHAQTIEDPTSKPFKRSNRFSPRQNNWKLNTQHQLKISI